MSPRNDSNNKHDWRAELNRLEGAYAPSTMRSYYSDVQAFVDWCNWTQRTPFPASVETVCEFIEEQGKEKAASTVRRRLYAIRKIHRLLRLYDPTYDEEINLSLRRVRRAKLVRPKLNFVAVAGHWGTLPQSVKGAPNGTTSTQLYRRL